MSKKNKNLLISSIRILLVLISSYDYALTENEIEAKVEKIK